MYSDVAGVNKGVTGARTTTWPMKGGLQSITNTSVPRAQQTVARGYVDVPGTRSVIEAIPEVLDAATAETKTPSPKKVTIQIEPASGKENFAVPAHVQS
jgi:hypothetical protein